MKRVCCCFTWIVFIELKFHNLTDLRVRWGDGEFQEMGGGILVMVVGGMILKWGVDTPLWAHGGKPYRLLRCYLSGRVCLTPHRKNRMK